MSKNSRQHFPAEYLADMTRATEAIQAQTAAVLQGIAPMPFAWLKVTPAYPAFCDQAFAFRNQVFAYLIDVLDAQGHSTLTAEAKTRLLAVAEQNNLIPCRFPMKADHTLQGTGWNLLKLDSDDEVTPEGLSSDAPVPRSAWECLSIALAATLEWMQGNRAGDIIAACSIPGADPQIWFHENDGGQAWILIRRPDEPAYDDEAFLKENPTLKSYNGYECRVAIIPSEPTDTQIYRGHGVNIQTDGPKKVHSAGDSVFEETRPLGSSPLCLEEPKEEQEVDGKGCLLFLVAGIAGLIATAATAAAILC